MRWNHDESYRTADIWCGRAGVAERARAPRQAWRETSRAGTQTRLATALPPTTTTRALTHRALSSRRNGGCRGGGGGSFRVVISCPLVSRRRLGICRYSETGSLWKQQKLVDGDFAEQNADVLIPGPVAPFWERCARARTNTHTHTNTRLPETPLVF